MIYWIKETKSFRKREEIQKEIDAVIEARKELFKTRDILKENIEILYKSRTCEYSTKNSRRDK